MLMSALGILAYRMPCMQVLLPQLALGIRCPGLDIRCPAAEVSQHSIENSISIALWFLLPGRLACTVSYHSWHWGSDVQAWTSDVQPRKFSQHSIENPISIALWFLLCAAACLRRGIARFTSLFFFVLPPACGGPLRDSSRCSSLCARMQGKTKSATLDFGPTLRRVLTHTRPCIKFGPKSLQTENTNAFHLQLGKTMVVISVTVHPRGLSPEQAAKA